MKRSWLVLVLIWAVMVCGGAMAYAVHQHHQGPRGSAPARWPAGSQIRPAAGQATLLVFLHPNCPCSKATVHNLQSILSELAPAQRPRTIFVLRNAAVDDWRAKNLIASTAAVPDAELFHDSSEREMDRFGSLVSGHVLVYDRAGRLAFDGGVTEERGHEGRGVASDRLADALTSTTGQALHTAVYGCLVRRSARANRKEASCPRS